MLVRVLVVARKDFSHIFENHNLRSPLSSRELSLRWYEVKMPASEIIHVKGLKISILDVEKFWIKRWLWGSKWRYTIGYQLFRWTMSDSSEGSEKPVPELSLIHISPGCLKGSSCCCKRDSIGKGKGLPEILCQITFQDHRWIVIVNYQWNVLNPCCKTWFGILTSGDLTDILPFARFNWRRGVVV